jgi:co-chaperonin GroES (HSP10)
MKRMKTGMTAIVALENGGKSKETDDLGDLFPTVPPNIKPFGSRVLVQIRRARKKSEGGIFFAQSTKDTELDNTCVAKVVAVGPLAYKNRNTMEPWAEGQWCAAGAYVFVPKYGGVRWEAACSESDVYGDKVQFAIFDDLNIIGAVDDPLRIKAHV